MVNTNKDTFFFEAQSPERLSYCGPGCKGVKMGIISFKNCPHMQNWACEVECPLCYMHVTQKTLHSRHNFHIQKLRMLNSE